MAKAKAKDNGALNTADRQAFSRLIRERKETIHSALEDELTSDTTEVAEDLRRKKGITATPAEIRNVLKSMDAQIKTELERHLESERRRVQIEKAEVEELFFDSEREMKERHKTEWRALQDDKKKKKSGFTEQLKSAEDKIKKEKIPDLMKKYARHQADLATTEQAEMIIQAEAKTRVAIIRKSQGRIHSMIADAANRATEELWMVETREEARDLLQKIPTVAEAIDLCQSEEGLNAFMRRIDPNTKLLTAPPVEKKEEPDSEEGETESDDEPDTIEADFSVIDDEEDDDDDSEYEHDREVYRDRDNSLRR